MRLSDVWGDIYQRLGIVWLQVVIRCMQTAGFISTATAFGQRKLLAVRRLHGVRS